MARTKSVDDFIIDFKKEEQGGGGIRVKRGQYPVKIAKAKAISSEEKGTPGLEIIFVFTEGRYKGKRLRERLWASPKAYARFRTLLEACGKRVPQRVNLLKIAKAIVGCELVIDVDDEPPREGYSTRSRVTFEGFISIDDYEDEEEDEEEDDEDEDLEDEDEDDDEELDEDEEGEEPEPPKRKRRTSSRTKAGSKLRRRSEPEDDDDDDLDLDEF